MSKHAKSSTDNRSNQLNPHHPAYYASRGVSPGEALQRAQQASSTPSQTAQSDAAEAPSAVPAAPPAVQNPGKST